MEEKDLLGLSYPELLGLIQSPREPTPISMWPETQIWGWIGLVALILSLRVSYNWYKRYQANAYRRAGIKALQVAGDNANAIATIIRQVALISYPRQQVASLHGEQWLSFLDSSTPNYNKQSCFCSEIGEQMLRAPYLLYQLQINGLNALAIDWVNHHDTTCPLPQEQA